MILSSCRLRKSLTVVLGLGLITIPMMMGSKCKIQFGNEATRVIRGSQTPVKKQYFSGTGSGVLQAESKRGAWLGECPLLSTDVDASVAGYVSQVSVKQRFKNTFSQSIEAVYTFPLPENAAVDEMIMHVGNRVIRGSIKTREAARKSYEDAKAKGKIASLLDQERPNIFTQSVANIEPGAEVEIEIRYVALLKYEAGSFTFAFPTVVGPRFVPGAPKGHSGTGHEHDTAEVPDASRITPQYTRSGTNLNIALRIDAGVPIQDLHSAMHDIGVGVISATESRVWLQRNSNISNSDFVVSWQVDGDRIKSGYLTHCDKGDGYFTVMLLPPRRVGKRDVSPKEMIFLVDCSGSQAGDPLEKVKQTLNYCVDNLNPDDTFQIVCFGNELRVFPERPMVLSANMALEVRRFVAQLEATGGTWMAPAVEKVCSLPPDRHRLRIVSLMTDGFIGNDMEIVDTVKKFRGSSRWFPFGTGSGVNRFLIEAIATEGGGEPEYVDRKDETKAVAKHFFERVSSPVLTDVKVGFQGVEPIDVFPSAVADVWAERPLFIKGRYAKPGTGKVILTGFAGGKPYRQELPGFSSAASWQPIARVGLGSRESRPDNLE